jgi:hypothetical protein
MARLRAASRNATNASSTAVIPTLQRLLRKDQRETTVRTTAVTKEGQGGLMSGRTTPELARTMRDEGVSHDPRSCLRGSMRARLGSLGVAKISGPKRRRRGRGSPAGVVFKRTRPDATSRHTME